MKFTMIRTAVGLMLTASIFSCPNAHAGWGMLRGGSSGGSTGYSSYGGGSTGYSAAYGSSGSSAAYGSSGYSAAYGSSGYSAAYGSSGYAAYSSTGGSSGGSSGGPGLLQRLHARVHDHIAAKRARHAARRASYGSSGYYASSGGSTGYSSYASYGSSGGGYSGYSSYYGGSTGVSYGSTGANYGSTGYSSGVSYGSTGYSSGVSYGSTGGVGYGSASTYYGASNDAASESQSFDTSLVTSVKTETDAVYLLVAVPGNAKVFVNDNATTSTGAIRKFVSHGLKYGKQYRFNVRAEMTAADGKLLTEEKSLVVSGGSQEEVQFAFAESSSPIETAVTLNLPAEAKVILAGSETKATGETRTFRTGRLKPGEVWDDYEIEVHYDGRVKKQAVRLLAGDSLQLTFDFDDSKDKIASR